MKKRLAYSKRCGIFAFLCVLPWLLGFLIFTLKPLIDTVIYSFSITGFHPDGTVELLPNGWKNYNAVLNENADFRLAIFDYLEQMGFTGITVIVFSLLIALLLNGSFKGRSFFRMIFFMPVVLMQGPLMSIARNMGGLRINGVNDMFVFSFIAQNLPEAISYPILSMINRFPESMWFCGVQILICLAGLQKMDRNAYEAASIDGASAWQIFWKITLPLARPFLLLSALYTIIDLSTQSDNAFMSIIIDNMFNKGSGMGYSAAVTCLYFLVILALLGIVFLILGNYGKRRQEA